MTIRRTADPSPRALQVRQRAGRVHPSIRRLFDHRRVLPRVSSREPRPRVRHAPISCARCGGADEAISQYFFNNDAYYAFVDNIRRLGVEIPIIAGLMPITDYAQIARFSAFCGADIPAWIRKRMEAFANDPASQKAFGIEIATRQAEDLLKKGAPGIHFYTLNKAEATLRIWKNLGLFPAPQRAHGTARLGAYRVTYRSARARDAAS